MAVRADAQIERWLGREGEGDTMAVTQGQEHEREVQALKAEVAEQDGLCRAGVAADVVVHELSNMLNAILLQTAVVQQKAAEPLRSELNGLRDQGRGPPGLETQVQPCG